MRYLSNHLIDFDEICTALHISYSVPIGDQKFDNFENLNPRLLTVAILKIEKSDISYAQF